MTGTWINIIAIIAGSLLGMLLHSKFPERLNKIIFTGIGLFTLFLGFSMAGKTSNYLILVFSIILGGMTGELLHIDKAINRFGEFLKKKSGANNSKFTEGLVTAFLLFCMGSMTILGAIEEGLGDKPNLLLAKSILDGFSSIALAAAFGIGVLFSIIPLFLFQGGITLFAAYLGEHFSELLINELTAAGGLILIGMGITILEIKPIKVVNFLPALVYAPVLAYFIPT